MGGSKAACSSEGSLYSTSDAGPSSLACIIPVLGNSFLHCREGFFDIVNCEKVTTSGELQSAPHVPLVFIILPLCVILTPHVYPTYASPWESHETKLATWVVHPVYSLCLLSPHRYSPLRAETVVFLFLPRLQPIKQLRESFNEVSASHA